MLVSLTMQGVPLKSEKWLMFFWPTFLWHSINLTLLTDFLSFFVRQMI